MRADKYFSEKFGSRTKAQEILKEGLVLLNGKPVRPKDEVSGTEAFVFLENERRFVSAGGKKLEKALVCFGQDADGEVAADLGASTGGFTHCLLMRNVAKVYCVDVGESQLDERLLRDERVVVMDKTNARYLTAQSFPEPVSLVTGDLSFISLKLVLPAVKDILRENGRAFLLFKPQFECNGKKLNGNGILSVKYHATLLSEFYDHCLEIGLYPQNIVNAPLVPKKNVEYVVFLKKNADALKKTEFLRRAAQLTE